MSTSLLPWLVTLALLLSGWALFNVYRSRQWLLAIQEELALLQTPPPSEEGVEAMPAASEPPGLECVIRLRDPLRVAEQESGLAWTVTGIAPHLITREVYRQVREETLLLLAKRDIEADVHIRVH